MLNAKLFQLVVLVLVFGPHLVPAPIGSRTRSKKRSAVPKQPIAIQLYGGAGKNDLLVLGKSDLLAECQLAKRRKHYEIEVSLEDGKLKCEVLKETRKLSRGRHLTIRNKNDGTSIYDWHSSKAVRHEKLGTAVHVFSGSKEHKLIQLARMSDGEELKVKVKANNEGWFFALRSPTESAAERIQKRIKQDNTGAQDDMKFNLAARRACATKEHDYETSQLCVSEKLAEEVGARFKVGFTENKICNVSFDGVEKGSNGFPWGILLDEMPDIPEASHIVACSPGGSCMRFMYFDKEYVEEPYLRHWKNEEDKYLYNKW